MGVELAACSEPVGWAGNRNLIVPPDIVPVRRVSPIPRKKKTLCQPRPDGEPICRAGDREWFSDRVFVEFHTRDSRVAHGSSVSAHASCLIGVLLLISGQPAPTTPVRVSWPLRMPAFVAVSGGGGSAPQLIRAASEPPAAASPTERVARTEPSKKVSTVPPPPPNPVAPKPLPDPEPRRADEEETRIASHDPPDSSEDPCGGGAEGDVGAVAGNGPSSGGSGTGAGTGVGGTSGAGVGDGQSGVGMAPGPYRLGKGIEPPRKIKDVRPRYPAGALSSRALGTVLIEAVVGEDGKVHDAKVLHSIPLLDQAALDAVRQWEFVPSKLNGVAVAVIITVLVQFSIH